MSKAQDLLETIKVNTSGDGLHSETKKEVEITKIEIDFEKDELRAFFKNWDIEEEGLIYTDKGFIEELKEKLSDVIPKIAYSEQGMQDKDYVSFDI